MDKIMCECGNQMNEHHGTYTKVRAGKKYLLYYCPECKTEYAVNANDKTKVKNYTLDALQ